MVAIIIYFDLKIIYISKGDTRGPVKLLAADDMDMEVVDALAALATIVYHSSVPIFVQALKLCGLRDNNHQMTQEGCVGIVGFA